MSKKSKKIRIPKPTNGYGYVGVWNKDSEEKEMSVGWLMPQFVAGEWDKKYPDIHPDARDKKSHTKGERFFLCEIIVTPLKDKLGRPITKIIK